MIKIKRWYAAFALPVALGISTNVMAATCDYKITNEWNDGFAVSVTILNNTQDTINGWSTSFTYSSAAITQLWNGALAGNNPYTVSSLSYNQSISPNESVAFGFNASKNQSGSAAETPVLDGVCSSVVENRAPVANGTTSTSVGTIPFDVVFDASTSTDPDGDPLTYLWDFGNGETATTAVVTRSFATAGSFVASLVVSDGQLSSLPKSFTVTANTTPNDEIAYTLDGASSSLHFVSTKKTHVIESHTFTALTGHITQQGSAQLLIDLNTVDTNNATRDGRMKTMLFETDVYAQATVSLVLDPLILTSQVVGTTQTQTLAATLDLHGVPVLLNTDVWVSKLSDTKFLVQNVTPVLLNTEDFSLTAGVEALRNIANLSVISYAVPVNFNLVFTKTVTQP